MDIRVTVMNEYHVGLLVGLYSDELIFEISELASHLQQIPLEMDIGINIVFF